MRPGGCPAHVGRRNYVPLLCGVDTELRYYVIRDCYLNTVVPLVDTDLRYYVTCLLFKYCGPSPPLPPQPPSRPSPPLPSLPLVTQQIHCPFQPKQSPSLECPCHYVILVLGTCFSVPVETCSSLFQSFVYHPLFVYSCLGALV